MYLPNWSGDKYWTLVNETKLNTLHTQLDIFCNFNKYIKFMQEKSCSVLMTNVYSDNLGEINCFPFLFNKWTLHVIVSSAMSPGGAYLE